MDNRSIVNQSQPWQWIKIYQINPGTDREEIEGFIRDSIIEWLKAVDKAVKADFWFGKYNNVEIVVILLNSNGDPWEGRAAGPSGNPPFVPAIPELDEYIVLPRYKGGFSFEMEKLLPKLP